MEGELAQPDKGSQEAKSKPAGTWGLCLMGGQAVLNEPSPNGLHLSWHEIVMQL